MGIDVEAAQKQGNPWSDFMSQHGHAVMPTHPCPAFPFWELCRWRHPGLDQSVAKGFLATSMKDPMARAVTTGSQKPRPGYPGQYLRLVRAVREGHRRQHWQASQSNSESQEGWRAGEITKKEARSSLFRNEVMRIPYVRP